MTKKTAPPNEKVAKKVACAKKPKQPDITSLNQCIGHQKDELHKHSCACVPDHGAIEDSRWLMNHKADFAKRTAQMKTEWDTFVEEHKEEEFDFDEMHPKIEALHEKWKNKHRIGMMAIVKHGDKCHNMAESLDDIDFRPHKTICHRGRTNSKGKDKEAAERSRGIGAKFLKNLERLHTTRQHSNGIKAKCKLHEITLIGHGTCCQELHCDFVSCDLGADGNPKHESVMAADRPKSLEDWHGSMIHHFRSDEPELKGPSLGTVSGDKQRQHAVKVLPQGHVCMFGPDHQHCGGINEHPHIRVHAHFDHPKQKSKRRSDNVHLPEWGGDVKRKTVVKRTDAVTTRAIKESLVKHGRTCEEMLKHKQQESKKEKWLIGELVSVVTVVQLQQTCEASAKWQGRGSHPKQLQQM